MSETKSVGALTYSMFVGFFWTERTEKSEMRDRADRSDIQTCLSRFNLCRAAFATLAMFFCGGFKQPKIDCNMDLQSNRIIFIKTHFNPD